MPNQYTVKRTKVQRLRKFLKPNTPKKQFLMFIAAFMIIGGGYMAFRSFAATGLTGADGEFTALAPARILDTRDGNGGYTTPVSSTQSRTVQITGKGGVPATGVKAVVMNVTVTGGTANSFITIWPTGASKPQVSNVNFATGQTIPNQVTVKVGADGKVQLANAVGNVNVIFDVAGYYSASDGTPGSRFTSLSPSRIFDTRTGVGGYSKALGQGQTYTAQIAGKAGIPSSGVKAVVMNVTATGGTANSFLTVWPSGVARPVSSNVNFGIGETIPNQVTVKVGDDGRVQLYNALGNVNVIFDVAGYFSDVDPDNAASRAGRFVPVDPVRVFDSRSTGPIGQSPTDIYAGTTGGKIPSDATAAVYNVTVTGGTAPSFLTIYPSGESRPPTSSLNFAAGQTIANQVTVGLGNGSNGELSLFNAAGKVHVILDLAGYYYGNEGSTSLSADATTETLRDVQKVEVDFRPLAFPAEEIKQPIQLFGSPLYPNIYYKPSGDATISVSCEDLPASQCKALGKSTQTTENGRLVVKTSYKFSTNTPYTFTYEALQNQPGYSGIWSVISVTPVGGVRTPLVTYYNGISGKLVSHNSFLNVSSSRQQYDCNKAGLLSYSMENFKLDGQFVKFDRHLGNFDYAQFTVAPACKGFSRIDYTYSSDSSGLILTSKTGVPKAQRDTINPTIESVTRGSDGWITVVASDNVSVLDASIDTIGGQGPPLYYIYPPYSAYGKKATLKFYTNNPAAGTYTFRVNVKDNSNNLTQKLVEMKLP